MPAILDDDLTKTLHLYFLYIQSFLIIIDRIMIKSIKTYKKYKKIVGILTVLLYDIFCRVLCNEVAC